MKPRIVVIDDEAAICELMSKVLLRAGFEVESAATGEAGLALLEVREAQCVVVDKLLPSMNGLEVMAAVRRRWPRTGIVLVTAHPEPFTLEAERPEVVLAKPFKNLAAIEEAVREAVEAHHPTGALTDLRDRVAAVVGRRKRD